MNVADFDFELPDELIAQHPKPNRADSRLLILERETGHIRHGRFRELPGLLRRGDVLAINDTKVFPARLLGRRRPGGGAVECLLIPPLPPPTRPTLTGPGSPAPSHADPPGPSDWGVATSVVCQALMHPGQKLKPGSRVVFDGGNGLRIHGEVLERHFQGRRTIRLWTEPELPLRQVIDAIGHIPLPPYIRRADRHSDRDRYQTVFAAHTGSIAAPTAGLHFTQDLLGELERCGVERVTLTLHVGYGTFKPVRVDRVEDHAVDPEVFAVPPSSAAALTRARREGRRIIAVGTTTTRALESLPVDADGAVRPASGSTDLFIRPGHRFTLVDGIVTNFHLPRSSLLMLVAAFAGRERVLAAYRQAVEHRYRFYSYGDAMIVL